MATIRVEMATKLQHSLPMPLAQTHRFGPLEYEDTSALTFPAGLPGFDGHHSFLLVERTDIAPIIHLQSLETASLCFLAAPVLLIDPSYTLAMTGEDQALLGSPADAKLLCLALLSAPETGPLTANLLAPVVINLNTRIGVQAVRADARYSHQHLIASETAC